MDVFFDLDYFTELLANKNYRQLRSELPEQNPVDIALFIETLSPEKALLVFRMLPKEMAAEVFSYFESDTQQYIAESITEIQLSEIIEDLFVDDAVDMLEELPASVVTRVLKHTNPETRKLINQFLKYNENTAGSIMTAEFIDLRKKMTVEDAIKRIRRIGEAHETIYTCYVIDEGRFLEGVITVKTLLLSQDDERIYDLMETNVIKASTNDDKEDVAYLFSKYDLLSIPVVDQENRLVGIVTVDDAVDVLEDEATEDFEKMAAMLPSEKPYLKTGVFTHAKNRLVWLMVLMVSGMITGTILGKYEAAFATIPLLVTFIPMLTDTGGNAGSQSSTLIIRGMAISEINQKDFWKVIWKELRVSIVVGIPLCTVNFLRILIFNPESWLVSLTVTITLYATLIMAKTIGGALPLLAKLLNLDPAIMASPLITTIVDACSLIIYSSLAVKLLHL